MGIFLLWTIFSTFGCITSALEEQRSTEGVCPSDWQYFNHSCYKQEPMARSWMDAHRFCRTHYGAELVSVHSQEENLFIYRLIHSSKQNSWLGLHQSNNTRIDHHSINNNSNNDSNNNNTSSNMNMTWFWADGNDYAQYQNWMPGRPIGSSSSNSSDSQDIILCGEMVALPMISSGQWNIRPCTSKQSFICKIKNLQRSRNDHGVKNTSKMYIKHNKQNKRLRTKKSNSNRTKRSSSNRTKRSRSIRTQRSNSNRTKRSSSNRFSLRENPFFAAINDHANQNVASKINDFHESIQRLMDKKSSDKFNIIHRFINSRTPIEESDETHEFPDYYMFDYGEYDYNSMYNDDSLNDVRHVATVTPPNPMAKLSTRNVSGMEHTSNLQNVEEELSMGPISSTYKSIPPTSSYTQFNPDFYPQNDEESTLVATKLTMQMDTQLNLKIPRTEISNTTGESIATPPKIDLVCNDGWTHSPDLQKCYKVHKHPLTWSTSENHCTANGGNLASINSVMEENFIHNMLMTGSMPTLYNKIWIGLRRTCGENQSCEYAWSDCSNKTFLNWDTDADQSDNEFGITENCGAADLVTMKLTENKCLTYYPYICEMTEGRAIPTPEPPTEQPVEDCEADDKSWLLYDGHCYKAVSATQEEYSFWKSRKRCQEEGAELVSIHSPEENHFINTMIYNLRDSSLWIGGEANIDSGFHWLDNTSFNFFIWASGEPNNVHDQESCVTMYTRHNNGYWNDENCARKMGRICKRPHGATLPPPATTSPPSGHCPQGWTHLAGHCLQMFGGDNATDWKSARQHCKSLSPGTDLASIHNYREQAAITALVAAVGYNVWIGFFNDKGFHWADQSEVEYTHWAIGEPNGMRYSRPERCVEVIGSSHHQKGRWNDVRCSEDLGYICQMPTDPNIMDHQSPPTCDGDYEHYFNYSGACYKPVDQHETWEDAEVMCNKEGADLASIMDIAENSYILLQAIEAGLPSVWLGLNSLQDSSGGNHQFSWSDGWPMLLSNWGPGQPNTSLTDHRCAHFNIHDGLWYTGKCASEMPYICKYKDTPAPTPDPPSSGLCPDGRWKDLGGGYCYLIHMEHKPWNEASRDCMQESIDNNTSLLISIHTQSELDLILQLTSHITDPIWIGLTQDTDGFGWSDGTGLDFINWAMDEPNSDEEHCGELYTHDGKWNDVTCDNARPFICKIRKTPAMASTSSFLSETQSNFSSTGLLIGPGLSAGIIITVVFSVVFVIVVVGLMAYRYYIKQRPINRVYSYSNQSYRGGILDSSPTLDSEDTSDI